MEVRHRRRPKSSDVLFWAAVACQAGVWVLVTIGGVVNTGFKQYEQYLSTLAARGAIAPEWGLAALLLLSVGLFLLVPTLFAWRRFVGVCVFAAAVASVSFSGMQVACPPRARFCVDANPASLDIPHATAVVAFSGALLVAVIAGLMQIWHGAGQPRLWPAAVVGIVLVAACSPWLVTLTGLPQRLALMGAQLAILGVAAAAHGELGRRERLALKQQVGVPMAVDA